MKHLSYIVKAKDKAVHRITQMMAVIMTVIAVVSVSFCVPVFASDNDDNGDFKVTTSDVDGFLFEDVTEERLSEYEDLINSTLKVGYVDGLYPFSYTEDGEFAGLTRLMFEAVADKYDMSFEFFSFENSTDANMALREGTIDLIGYYADTNEALNQFALEVTDYYVKAPLVIIKKEDSAKELDNTCATVLYLFDETSKAINMGKYSIDFYDSEEKCLDAVANDKVRITVCNGYLSQHYLSANFKYNELSISAVLDVDYYVCAAVKGDNIRLRKLLNLVMPVISDRAINEFSLESITSTTFSFEYFVSRYWWTAVILAFLIAAVVIVMARRKVRNSKELQKLLYMDSQMNIWNLNYLKHVGAKSLLNSDSKANYALCCINLGKFRRINLVYGFNRGTAVLRLLLNTFREKLDDKKEIYCRDHGDKFVMMLKYVDDEHLSKRLADIIADADRRISDYTDTHIAIQIGVYKLEENEDIALALDYAMQAMGAIRESKVSEVKIYDEELSRQIKEEHRKQSELDEKNIDEDFVTFYQAKVDINSGRVVGAEALVRMKDPENPGRVLSPGMFVPYYEQTGFITEVDFFVYRDVCRMLSERIQAGKPVVTVSVNFSRLHFVKKDFPERVEAVLSEYSIPSELIEVEITETLVAEQLQEQRIQDTVDELKRRNIRISIDDFGSGYSSLGIIERIPASVIKLDRSFLINHKDRNRQIALMRGIVSMAKDLNAQIVCEGVETDDDIELMKMIGASVAQGYYYSKPVPEEDFINLLEGQD